MTDRYPYKCGKCARTFDTPEQLKDHQIPCRGKKPTPTLELPVHHHRNELERVP